MDGSHFTALRPAKRFVSYFLVWLAGFNEKVEYRGIAVCLQELPITRNRGRPEIDDEKGSLTRISMSTSIIPC